MLTIHALKEVITSGSNSFTVYIGFASSAEILAVAEAPAFGDTTTHAQIAANIMTHPIDDWQRPIDDERVNQISTLYSNAGEFMPNPVLLGENVVAPAALTISPLLVSGHQTGLWTIQIPLPQPGNPKPLWILDGQHRIKGLSRSAQSANHIPIVFLLNAGNNHYGPAMLAKIFAQVTTSAHPLNPLHDDWLSFAFRLKTYSPAKVTSPAQIRAMECIAELCKLPTLPGNRSNSFLNRVQFNPLHKPPAPNPAGFSYSCSEFRELLFQHYYNRAALHPHLNPNDLAVQLSLAHTALTQVVRPPHDRTVFLGAGDHAQVIMQDALLAGILEYMLNRGVPASWVDVFRTLGFQTTIWDFSWKRSLHGNAGKLSKELARHIFIKIFRDAALPAGVTNLADYMKGDSAEFLLEAFEVNATGRIRPATRLEFRRGGGARTTFSIGPRTVLRLKRSSLNVAKVVVTDKNSPPGNLVDYSTDMNSKAGLRLDPNKHKRPLLELLFTLHHYGDNKTSSEIDIDWPV